MGSKQGLVEILVERVRDSNSYTRAHVMQTWEALAENNAIPIGHFVTAAQLAIGMLTCFAHFWNLDTCCCWMTVSGSV